MTPRPAGSAAAAPDPEPGAAALADVVTGLALAREQLGEVIAMLEQGGGCQDVVESLSVVTRAVDRAGFAVIAAGMRECIVHPGQGMTDTAGMEKLFLSLA